MASELMCISFDNLCEDQMGVSTMASELMCISFDNLCEDQITVIVQFC